MHAPTAGLDSLERAQRFLATYQQGKWRFDVFLSGDLALRRAIQRAYGFDHLPTEDEVAQVSDRWRPYRSLAVSYLFASEYDAHP